MWNYLQNETLRDVYNKTKILRKPITGIVTGYHQLPYILIAPDDENPGYSIEINGKINVSPKFILSSDMLGESFSEVFDPETFDKEIQGRLFSFAHGGHKNVKVESEYFRLDHYEENPESRCERVSDSLMMEENTKTALIFNPKYQFYPVSIDRFISEIMDREFRI